MAYRPGRRAARPLLALAALCAAFPPLFLSSCEPEARDPSETFAFSGSGAADAIRGRFEIGRNGEAVLLALDEDEEGSIRPEPVKAAGLAPAAERRPWALAPSVSFLAVSGGRIFAAINRVGVLTLEAPEGQGLLWTLARDPGLFGKRSAVSAWCRGGRFYVFLARSDAFEEGRADPRLVSIAPGEFRFRTETALEPGSLGPGEELTYLCPVDPDHALAELSRKEGEKAEFSYLRVALADGSARRIGKAEYLAAFSFARPADLDPGLRSLCDPERARARYREKGAAAFVFLWSGSSARTEERAYALAGSQDSEWSASLSAWEDSGARAVLYPDGSLRLSGLGVAEAAMPALPYAFDYDRLALSGGLAAASWAESVYPDLGRAGLALMLFPRAD